LLPCRNTYLDPSQTWLEFSVSIDATGTAASGTILAAQLDGSAHSLIRKIEVYSSAGSNLLESIDNYAVLYHACANVVGDIDDFSGVGGITQGVLPPQSYQTQGGVALAPVQNFLSSGVKNRNLDGAILIEAATNTGTASASADGVYTFQLPIMWCVIAVSIGFVRYLLVYCYPLLLDARCILETDLMRERSVGSCCLAASEGWRTMLILLVAYSFSYLLLLMKIQSRRIARRQVHPAARFGRGSTR
jgi:hypothetical protein